MRFKVVDFFFGIIPSQTKSSQSISVLWSGNWLEFTSINGCTQISEDLLYLVC